MVKDSHFYLVLNIFASDQIVLIKLTNIINFNCYIFLVLSRFTYVDKFFFAKLALFDTLEKTKRSIAPRVHSCKWLRYISKHATSATYHDINMGDYRLTDYVAL